MSGDNLRKVIATEFVTLDGFMSDPEDEMRWVLDIFDEEMGEEIKSQQSSVGTILLGRVTYDIMAPYWPSATAETEDPMIIEHMNNTPKVVFSRTLRRVDWNNSRLASEDIRQEVQGLKQQPGKDMAIVGSASIVQALAELGLIDEYRLLLHPVVLGKGKPLFKDSNGPLNLMLVASKPFKNGVLGLTYEPARKERG
jgi:dihydrofolate reductase